jgi:outer membrane receptor for ferrienterochelin and colicins
MPGYSYISFTQPNAESSSWLFKQTLEWRVVADLNLSAGLHYERKKLTKSYDMPGYWEGALSSTAPEGTGIGHSSDAVYVLPPGPGNMPESNFDYTNNVGAYLHGIYDWDKFCFNLGLRYDHHTHYGARVTPRIAMIYKPTDEWTTKLIYGTAFQEPANIQLWGGWNGRASNPNMRPEETHNLEWIVMRQVQRHVQEISLFRSYYDNVIKEEAENAGKRDVWGLEYRSKFILPNFLADSKNIALDFNYTYTRERSEIFYNPTAGE